MGPCGDQAYLNWRCEDDTHNCRGTFAYTGGTERYKGISGNNTFNAGIQANWPDGMATVYAPWDR